MGSVVFLFLLGMFCVGGLRLFFLTKWNIMNNIFAFLDYMQELLCWHQWKDFNLKDYATTEQWCIHCGKWRNKQR